MPTEENMRVDDVMDDVLAAQKEVTPSEPEAAPAEPAKEAVETPSEEKSSEGRERDDKGRFVSRETKPEDTARSPATELSRQQQEPQGQEQQPRPPAPTPGPAGVPPPGWSIKSKSEWEQLPEHVRADVLRREQEVNRGLAEYAGLRPYADRARQSGITLSDALARYVQMEDILRQDKEGGFLHIAENMRLTQNEAATLFANLAQRLGHQPAAGQADAPADQNAEAQLRQWLNPMLTPLQQQIQQLERQLVQQTQQQRTQHESAAQKTIEQFRADPAHRYYDNLEDSIGTILEKGLIQRTGDYSADLKAAYDLACRLDPEISELLINERIAKSGGSQKTKQVQEAEKARAASRSINGSPSPGAAEGKKAFEGSSYGSKTYNDDLEDDIRAAVRASRA